MTASETSTATGRGRRRLHPLTPLYDLLNAARSLWIVVIPLLRPGRDPTEIIVPLIVMVLVGGRILGWFFTSYELTDDALIFDTGILQRKNRTVPYGRVQQVDVVQKLRHRLFGVARLDVSTAGGGTGREVRLEVLSVAEAGRLQRAIEAARRLHPADTAESVDSDPVSLDTGGEDTVGSGAAAGVPPAQAASATTLLRLSVPELALAGVTGARLLVVLGAAGTLANTLDDLPISLWDRLGEADVPTATAVTLALALLAGATTWFGLAALSSVVTDFDFTVRHGGARFSVTKGLLARNEVIIPDHRVQAVAFHQSILRRLLARAAVRVSSASGHFTIPLVPWSTGIDLLGSFAGSARLPELHPAPSAALRRAVVRRTAPAAVLTIPFITWTRPWGFAALGLIPLAAVAGWAAWRGLAHGYDEHLLVARRGALYRSFVVVPAAKAQSTRVVSSWFQRRAGLATLFVDVAGGASARVPDVEARTAGGLAEALVRPTRARTADDRRSRSDARPHAPR